MNLTEAVNVVRQFARNGNSTKMYTDAHVHRVIMVLGNHFIRKTGCLKTITTKTVAANATSIDLSALTGFRPHRLRRAYVDQKDTGSGYATVYESDMERTDYQTIREYRLAFSGTGTPEAFAFKTWTSAEIYPKAKYAYKIDFEWFTPFTTIDPGVTAGATALNVPDDLLYEALSTGGAAFLQKNEPEHASSVAQSWSLYQQFINEVKDQGSLAPRVIRRRKRV